MRVNVISESVFTVQGHGVHTAFTETVDQLREFSDWDVATNTFRKADVVHIHTVGPYALLCLLLNRHAIKVVSAHVTPDSFVGSLVGAKLWYPMARSYLRWFYNLADGVLAVSQETLDELKGIGVRSAVFLVPNTINTKHFATSTAQHDQARQELGIKPDEYVVLSTGQVQPRKRVDIFVKVAGELPDFRFIWVGGMPFGRLGADHAEMEEYMKSPPSNTVFTGVVPRAEVIKYYRAADLFFMPSMQETFGIVIIEAAAVPMPILLRDLEQYQITFGEGYETGSDEKFTSIIRRFRSDTAYHDKWRRAAAAIAQKYSSEAGAATLTAVYRKLIKNKT